MSAFFFGEAALVFDEVDEQIERFWRDSYGLALPQEQPLAGIESEGSELVHALHGDTREFDHTRGRP